MTGSYVRLDYKKVCFLSGLGGLLRLLLFVKLRSGRDWGTDPCVH
jgi:hypothetical protein